MKTTFAIPAIVLALTAFVASPLAFGATAADPAPKEKKEEKAKVKPYPLETCIVSGDKLGEMGKPVVFVHDGQEIKLCCKDCRKDFDKDPAKYLKKLEKK